MCKRSAGPTLTRRCWGSYKLNPRPSSRIAARRRQRGHRRQADDQGGHQLNLRSFLPLALNNLGSVYVDCGNLDLAAECYINALKIGHTRAHQGLARVHFLRNNRTGAFEEMTKLIEKARSNASAYEKRSEYCDRDLTKADLQMVTKLDPLRVYPYRYRAAVLMDNHKEKDAISELTKAIAFKADLNLLHLRAAFHEHVGDISGALRDCRAALSVDPNHQEMLELHHRVNSQEP